MTEWSGIPALIAFLGPSVTYEGDNSVMAQQSFRYLKKMFKRVNDPEQATRDFSIFNYLREIKLKLDANEKSSAQNPEYFLDVNNVDEALKVCTGATVS